MELFSDEALAIVVPIVVYWVYSGMYMALGHSVDKYRLHPQSEEDSKNTVSKRDVVKGVLLQQLVQAAVAAAVFTLTAGESNATAPEPAWNLTRAARQMAVGMAVVDGWQYAWWHRYMHANRFLYRHVHSWHHRLLLDTLGGALAFLASGMSPRAAILFFSLCAAKAVDDHCGLMLPGNAFHLCFSNNTAYHDVTTTKTPISDPPIYDAQG